MSGPANYEVTLDVRVYDRAALYRAALKRAQADGMTPREYDALRRGGPDPVTADLQMLFDPGVSPDGCTIIEGRAHAG